VALDEGDNILDEE